jgi:hypothetical protein
VNLDKALGNGGGGDELDRATRLIRQHIVKTMGAELVAEGQRRRGGR